MSAYSHVEWLDLHNDGILIECAIMKRDADGNIYHFQLAPLDNIDKERLRNIVMNRNAKSFPLWDLMQQVTLGNGVNALEYFHQLVKIKTPHGTIMDPNPGRRGAAINHKAQAEAQQHAHAQHLTEGNVDTRTTAQKSADTRAANKAKAAQQGE